ncbi:hypothetical protein [Caudoviricetes sp.]|nr:hypothetical protein [Caudoviricetes sp.]
MKETNILKETMLEASKLGLVVFRNNVGQLEDKTGRWVQFGLCKGSSDLIGWMRDTGAFVAIECKAGTAKTRPEQQLFIDMVAKSGGFSCVINDAKKLKTHLDEYIATRYSDHTTSMKGE